MIVKRRTPLIEKIFLTILSLIIIFMLISVIGIAIWLSNNDLSFLLGG